MSAGQRRKGRAIRASDPVSGCTAPSGMRFVLGEAPADPCCFVIYSCLKQLEFGRVPEVGATHVYDGDLKWCIGALRMRLHVVP